MFTRKRKIKLVFIVILTFITVYIIQVSFNLENIHENHSRQSSWREELDQDAEKKEKVLSFNNCTNGKICLKQKILKGNDNIQNAGQGHENRSCTFAYIKTHKTGSTTVYSVLMKYIKRKRLKVAIKSPNPFQGGYPGRIKQELIFTEQKKKQLRQVKQGEEFVIVDHFRFNHSALKRAMPKDTRYFTIIRQPWGNFQSSFYYHYQNPKPDDLRQIYCFSYPYFHIAKGRHMSITDYLQSAYINLNHSIPWYFRSKNYQSHDLGIDPLLEDDNEIKQAIGKLASQIDLVMITDFMDESMILLKKLLDMKWSDILYLDSGNEHTYSAYDYKKNTQNFRMFQHFYKLDIALYEYFNATFWKKVDEYGREKMSSNIKRLQLLRKSAKKFSRAKVLRQKQFLSSSKRRFEEENIKLFKEIKIDYNTESMARTLKDKITKKDPRLNSDQTALIVESMISNGGGCPV